MSAAPIKEPSRRRTKYIMFRVTNGEHREISRFARDSKQTIADLMREAAADRIKRGVAR